METSAQVRFWQTLGQELSAGTPLPTALRKAGAAAGEGLPASAAEEMARQVEGGKGLAAAILPFARMYDQNTLAAIEAGEQAGNLGEVASRIAQGLAASPRGERPALTAKEDEMIRDTLNEIFQAALDSHASDVAIESLEGGRVRIRQRIDGVMHEIGVLVEGSAEPLLARIKAMAGLDVADRRLPKDGRIHLRVGGEDIDVRLSTVPGVYGERAMMRLLRREVVALGLDKVGLTEENLATVRRFCHMPQGIVVVNGATGTGKTTLLYSMLLEIDAVANTILTVEDPVEYAFDRFTQIQIKPEIGLTFSRAIRSMLRQAPNVLMIGEIRDQEMLQMAVQSAMTGHLVLTTLHATTSPGAIRRMLDIGVAPFMINGSLIGVISQKLVRLLCPDCKQPTKVDESLLPAEVRQALQPHNDVTWFGPKGCPACTNTGYRGMTAIHEVLVMHDAIRQVVSTDPTATLIRQATIRQGMKTMLQDGLAKAAKGMTSVEEVLRVAPQDTHL